MMEMTPLQRAEDELRRAEAQRDDALKALKHAYDRNPIIAESIVCAGLRADLSSAKHEADKLRTSRDLWCGACIAVFLAGVAGILFLATSPAAC